MDSLLRLVLCFGMVSVLACQKSAQSDGNSNPNKLNASLAISGDYDLKWGAPTASKIEIINDDNTYTPYNGGDATKLAISFYPSDSSGNRCGNLLIFYVDDYKAVQNTYSKFRVRFYTGKEEPFEDGTMCRTTHDYITGDRTSDDPNCILELVPKGLSQFTCGDIKDNPNYGTGSISVNGQFSF